MAIDPVSAALRAQFAEIQGQECDITTVQFREAEGPDLHEFRNLSLTVRDMVTTIVKMHCTPTQRGFRYGRTYIKYRLSFPAKVVK